MADIHLPSFTHANPMPMWSGWEVMAILTMCMSQSAFKLTSTRDAVCLAKMIDDVGLTWELVTVYFILNLWGVNSKLCLPTRKMY